MDMLYAAAAAAAMYISIHENKLSSVQNSIDLSTQSMVISLGDHPKHIIWEVNAHSPLWSCAAAQ